MGNKSNKPADLSEDAIEVLMANTHFNRFEVIEWFEGFVKDYPNGKLSKADFEKSYKQIYPDGDPKKYAGRVFEVFDANESGSIEFNEFLLALSALSDRDVSKRLHLAFKIYDLNGNGQVDAKELTKMIDALQDLKGVTKKDREEGGLTKMAVGTILRCLDKNDDGALTEDEFVEGCLNNDIVMQLLLPPTTTTTNTNSSK